MRYVHCFVRVVGCGFPLVGFIGGWVVIGRGGGECGVMNVMRVMMVMMGGLGMGMGMAVGGC